MAKVFMVDGIELTAQEIAKRFNLTLSIVYGRARTGAKTTADFSKHSGTPKFLLDGKWKTSVEISQIVGLSRSVVSERIRMGAKKTAEFKCPKRELPSYGSFFRQERVKRVKGYVESTTMGDDMWQFWMKALR